MSVLIGLGVLASVVAVPSLASASPAVESFPEGQAEVAPDVLTGAAVEGTVAPQAPVVTNSGANEAACNPDGSQDVWFYGVYGRQICGYGSVRLSWPDGYARMFVIGTDHAVWNIVRYPNGGISGWRSLGGWLQSYVDAPIWSDAFQVRIHSIGADNRDWCKDLLSSGWYPWYRC